MHLFDTSTRFYGGNAIVGGGLPLAVGLALADKLQGNERVTACFFGEGAVAEGEFHESLNLAALWNLPVLFCCENNLYAMGTALERSESETDLTLKAASYEMPAWSVDGMDVARGRDRERGAPPSRCAPAAVRISSSSARTGSARIRCTTPSSTATSPRWRPGSNAIRSSLWDAATAGPCVPRRRQHRRRRGSGRRRDRRRGRVRGERHARAGRGSHALRLPRGGAVTATLRDPNDLPRRDARRDPRRAPARSAGLRHG